MTTSDLELLHRYAREGSEDSFSTLVGRHVDMVYSAALRQVGRPHLAQEVAQTVFIELARCADKMKPDSILGAWLHEVTRRRAIDAARGEARRQQRERTSHDLTLIEGNAPEWSGIAPLLDEAMQSLPEKDRRAIFLRYFENKSLREVGVLLGTSEDSAQKRVSRALEGLRAYFAKRKMPLGAAGLATALSTHAVASAPLGLGATISGAVLVAGPALQAAAIGAAKAITMTTIQKTLLAAVVTASIATGVYEARVASRLQAQVDALRQQQASESDRGAARLAALMRENERLRNDAERLRAESEALTEEQVASEAAAAANPSLATMVAWLERVEKLKERFNANPAATIPEMQLLDEEDWLSATKGNKLESEEDYRMVCSTLRAAAEDRFASKIRDALKKYQESNGQILPSDLAQLQPHFDPPADDAMLQRWAVFPADEVRAVVTGDDWVISQKAPVDDEYDQRTVIGPRSFASNSRGFTPEQYILPALNKAYLTANPGRRRPADLRELEPYATTPEQRSGLRRVIDRRAQAANTAP